MEQGFQFDFLTSLMEEDNNSDEEEDELDLDDLEFLISIAMSVLGGIMAAKWMGVGLCVLLSLNYMFFSYMV